MHIKGKPSTIIQQMGFEKSKAEQGVKKEAATSVDGTTGADSTAYEKLETSQSLNVQSDLKHLNVQSSLQIQHSAFLSVPGEESQLQIKTGESIAVPERIMENLQDNFDSLIDSTPVQTLMKIATQAFGVEKAEEMMAKLESLPEPAEVRFVSEETLKGASGAYSAEDGGTIYLSTALMDSPQLLQQIFNEEMGHHQDAILKQDGKITDSQGDEGEIFAKGLAQGEGLDDSDLESIKNQDDSNTIIVDGKTIQVENGKLKKAADWATEMWAKYGGDFGGKNITTLCKKAETACKKEATNGGSVADIQQAGEDAAAAAAAALKATMKVRSRSVQKTKNLIKWVKEDGWVPRPRTGTSHIQFDHPTKPGRVSISDHGKDTPAGTVKNILTQAGLL